MYIYQPKSILLPKNSSIRRILPKTSELNEAQQEKLDVRTIFYDVFLDRNTKELRALGPRLYNLRHEVFPLTILVNGEKVKFRLYHVDRLVFLESEKLLNSIPSSVVVTFQFNTFEKTIEIDWLRDERQLEQYDNISLTISTLQKNNYVEWISDWILWHSRLYDVKRIVLYDNGSSNQKQLMKCLKTLEPEVQIVFVCWPFPYGSKASYQFCQHGTLNHCRLKFPISSSYCINLDIDEYLVLRTSDSLKIYLDQKLNLPKLGVLIVKENLVPNLTIQPSESIVRCFNFTHRFRRIGNTRTGETWDEYGRTKYIYKFDEVAYNAVHRTISEKHHSLFQRFGLARVILFYVKKTVYVITHRFKSNKPPKPRIDSIYAEETELCFFHFLGLTAKKKLYRMSIKPDKCLLAREPLIFQMAKKAGLVNN